MTSMGAWFHLPFFTSSIKIQLIAVIHDLEALDTLEFHHIGQVIDNKDIIPALIVQTLRC